MDKIVETVRDEKGFTLLESLFVLSIFLIISSFSLFLLKPHQVTMEKELFITQLKADLLFAQQHALSTQKLVAVNFVNPRKYYYIRKYTGEILLEREYSERITVAEGSQPLYFRYHSSGNISSFGSIHIYIGDEIYRMMFQLGKGRFYVVKIK